MTKDELYLSCKDLINSYAHRAIKKSRLPLDYDDLLQEGNMAFIRATKKYDVDRNEAQFRTYLVRALINAYNDVINREAKRLIRFKNEEVEKAEKAENYDDFIDVLQSRLDQEEKVVFDRLYGGSDKISKKELSEDLGKSTAWIGSRLETISEKIRNISGHILDQETYNRMKGGERMQNLDCFGKLYDVDASECKKCDKASECGGSFKKEEKAMVTTVEVKEKKEKKARVGAQSLVREMLKTEWMNKEQIFEKLEKKVKMVTVGLKLTGINKEGVLEKRKGEKGVEYHVKA